MKLGSFFLPLKGSGARKGLSVSTNNFSVGYFFKKFSVNLGFFECNNATCRKIRI